MSRLGRSQPVPPFSSHGWVDPGPGPVGTTPARPTVIENDDRRRKTLPLQPVIINGLYAVSLAAPTVIPPMPAVSVPPVRPREGLLPPAVTHGFDDVTPQTFEAVEPEDKRRRQPPPPTISISGIRGFTPPPAFLQPLPTQLVVISDERGRRIYPQPVVLHGPAFPVEVIAALPPPVDTGGPMGAGPTIRGMRDIQKWRERIDDEELAIFLTIYLAT